MMVFYQEGDNVIKARNEIIKYVIDFKYLDSYMGRSNYDIEIRKALICLVLLSESILLYMDVRPGLERKIKNPLMEPTLECSGLHLLNVKWQVHRTNAETYYG